MQKNRIGVNIDKNAIIDDGNGTITFRGGLTLSDESLQKNGTRYDLSSMDLSDYNGKVFADHDYQTTGLIGKAFGVAKTGKRLVAEGVRFAIEQSGLANFVYDMVRNGWLTDVSIGTVGDMEMDEKTGAMVYKNSRLVEFSFVGIGNNDNARISALNAYEHAEAEGLNTEDLDSFLAAKNIKVDMPKRASQTTTITTTGTRGSNYTFTLNNNSKGTSTMSEPVKNDVGDEPKADPTPAPAAPQPAPDREQPAKSEPAGPAPDVSSFTEAVKNAIEAATKPLKEQVDKLEQNAFDKGAKEPEFVDGKNSAPKGGATNTLKGLPYEEITARQVNAFFKAEKQQDPEARKELLQLNQFNLQGLKEAGIVKNTVTIADFGNFVTNPELVTEIQGYRSDFAEVLAAFNYRETNALRMAWTQRTGDINMQPVELCDDGADGNLKPVSEYTLTPQTKDLEELAAVTPVCNAATIFLAVDLIQDVTQGYRTDYDRKLAQGIVGALEKALEANANNSQIGYSSGGIDTAPERLENFRKAIFSISQGNGIMLMNEATYGQIWGDLVATGNGGALTSTIQSGLTSQYLWGKRFVIAPNELMPTITTTETPSWTLDGATVTVNHAVMYVNPANFRGRQNGGLRFDLSTDAAYEVDGTVYSAYQRNEVVLRGSMFRGAAVLDPTRVRGVRAQDVIS